MIKHDKVLLRARRDSDVDLLHRELYEDVATRVRGDSRLWRPLPTGDQSPFAVPKPDDETPCFTVEEVASGDVAGEAVVWGVDLHNRCAHLGLALRPGFRGRGLAADTMAALCTYGFAVRGFHGLQVETLSENTPMLRAAQRVGFTVEGTLRRNAWVFGTWADEVILGLLAEEWACGRENEPR
ncbi:GNAT family protein [Streptomyces sp. NPDC006435]|uniref:GNAT family N-acetyltransferase n=1 Tax=Streptomyces sp. NPDC006435 TaxID=3154300 RepID=UPI0033B7F948